MHVSNVIRNLKIFRKIFRNWPCPLVTADSRPRKPGPAWSNPRYWGPPTRVSGEHEKTPHHHAGPTPRAVLPETRPVQCFYSSPWVSGCRQRRRVLQPPTNAQEKQRKNRGLRPSSVSGQRRPAGPGGGAVRTHARTHGGQQDRMIAGDPCVLPCQSEPDSRLGWPVPRSPRAALASGCFAGLRLRPIMMWGVAVSSCLRVQESIQPSRQ
jgi:hypothetical protein